MKNIISGYEQGADITIMNTIYHEGKFENGKYISPKIDLIYKDNTTGKKGVEQIDNPMYEYYLLNDNEYHVDYSRDFIEEELVHPVICDYSKLKYDIAEKTGNLEWYKRNKNTGNSSANSKIHYHPDVFMSDMNLSDHYRYQFDQNYKNDVCGITKMYFDIEVDSINIEGDFPKLGEAPVNAISCIMNHTVFSFIVRDPDNLLAVEFEEKIKKDAGSMERKFVKFIQDYVGGNRPSVYQKRLKALDLEELHIKFLFFDTEMQAISAFFGCVNKFKPDFVLAWNMGFDTPTLIERIKMNGYKPEDICCHPDFKKNRVAHYEIVYSKKDPDSYAERGDYCNISGYSNWVCQLIQFASKRKSQHAIENFKIDYIGQLICGVPKLDYSHICKSIKDLPRADFETFILYNIIDTIVQKCIEERVNDINYLFANSIKFNTRYSKVHRQSIFLANFKVKLFKSLGYIAGNNVNKDNEKIKYPGGFVANLNLISPYAMDKLNGVPIRLFRNLVDFDYKSLYPSIWRQWNMAKNTMIGQMHILEDARHGNKYGVSDYNRDIAFAQDIHAGNWVEFGYRWLNLADVETMVSDVETYFTDRIPRGTLNSINDETGLILPFSGTRAKKKQREEGKLIRPFKYRHRNKYDGEWSYADIKSYKPYGLDVPMEELYDVASNKIFEERPDVIEMNKIS